MTETLAGETLPQNPLVPGWVIRAKLSAPRQLAPLLLRQRLIAKLMDFSHVPALVLHGPAGYGKTTVANQWLQNRRQAGASIGWLALDVDDQNSSTFLSYLSSAISIAGIDLSATALFSQEARGYLNTRTFLDAAIAPLENHKPPLWIALDEFEILENSDAERVFFDLIEALPENVHFIIATRRLHSSRLVRLKARGLIKEIFEDDLRFNEDEVVSYFRRAASDGFCRKIKEYTQGWPLALQMVRMSLDEEKNLDPAVMQNCDIGNYMADYLAGEILEKLPSELQEFLIETAILDRVDADTADAIRNRADSHKFLSGLDSLAGLVSPIESERQTYMLHPIFRNFLRLQLDKRGREYVTSLNLSLANWQAMKGMHFEAVRTAVQCGMPTYAATLLSDIGLIRIWQRYGLIYMRSIVRAIPPEIVQEHPRLLLGLIVSLLHEGRIREARSLYNKVQKDTHNFTIDRGGRDDTDLKVESTTVDAFMMLHGDVIDRSILKMIDHFFAENVGPFTDEMEAEWDCALGIAMQQWGHFEDAQQKFSRSRKGYLRFNSLYGEFYFLIYDGWIAQARGLPWIAEKEYRSAIRLAQRIFGSDVSLRSLAEAMLAESLYLQNNLKDAQGILDVCLGNLDHSLAWYDFFAAGYVAAALLEFHNSGMHGALKAIARARNISKERDMYCLPRLLDPLQLMLLIRSNDLHGAHDFIKNYDIEAHLDALSNIPYSAWRERDLVYEAAAAYFISSENYGRAEKILAVYDADAIKTGRVRSQIVIAGLRAAIFWRQGDKDMAIVHLRKALALTDTHVAPRVLIDLDHLLRPIMDYNLGKTEDGGVNTMRGGMAALCDSSALDDKNIVALSDRERDILLSVSNGYSNKIIARNLDVTENTVKFYLKRLAVKLNRVGKGRVALVKEAQHRGWL